MAVVIDGRRTRGWQRYAAGSLFLAALLTIVYNVWMLVLAVLSFAGGTEVTVGVSRAGDTDFSGSDYTAFFSEATFWSGDFSFWPRIVIAIGRVLWVLIWIAVATCVLVFGYGAYHGEVFGARLPGLLMISALAVGIGATVANWLTMLGTSNGVAELAARDPEFHLSGWNWTTDGLWTILTGLVLALLAVVFRSGLKLQRDTEGLV